MRATFADINSGKAAGMHRHDCLDRFVRFPTDKKKAPFQEPFMFVFLTGPYPRYTIQSSSSSMGVNPRRMVFSVTTRGSMNCSR